MIDTRYGVENATIPTLYSCLCYKTRVSTGRSASSSKDERPTFVLQTLQFETIGYEHTQDWSNPVILMTVVQGSELGLLFWRHAIGDRVL